MKPNFIYGVNTVLNLIAAKHPIKKIYITRERFEKHKTKLKRYQFEILSFQQISNLLNKNNHHQGILAEINPFQPLNLKDALLKLNQKEQAIVLCLDNITDVGNFGAIIRTAAFFNVAAIIYSKHGMAPVNNAVYNAASGSMQLVDLVEVSNLTSTLLALKQNKFWVCGTVISDKTPDIKQIPFQQYPKLCLVIGNESKGIKPNVQKHCDFNCQIFPKNENLFLLDSLNVNAALSILLYEATK